MPYFVVVMMLNSIEISNALLHDLCMYVHIRNLPCERICLHLYVGNSCVRTYICLHMYVYVCFMTFLCVQLALVCTYICGYVYVQCVHTWYST